MSITEGTVPWPEDLAREYARAGWWRGQALGTEIAAAAAARETAIALTDGATRISYGSLLARAGALAGRLARLGMRPGDRIVVQLPNCWQFVVLTLACLRAGIVPVMALPAHRQHELAYLCEHSEARALAVPDVLRGFDHQQMAEELLAASPALDHILVAGQDVRHHDLTELCSEWPGAEPLEDTAAPVPPDPAGVAVFLLSGGTTGLPKLIARSHNDYSYNARSSARLCRLDEGTVYLVSLPASHNFPLACPGILGTLLSGGRVVMLGSPDPASAFAAIEREGVTITAVVPAVAQRWLAHAAENGASALRTLEVLQVGGARLADEHAARVRPVLGATLQQVFGMAEGLLNYTRLDDPDEVICGTQGRPLSPGDEVRIVDADGNDLPDGQPGALLTRGPYTPRGYYRAPEQNARAFTPDGWYASGDVVRRRPDRNLVVEGRDKDMINRGGEKISAEEVENLVYGMPGIAQVAAVAAPDAELGERICVFVVPEPGRDITLGAISDGMAAAGVARFKWPERLEIVAELPVTKVGKLDKKALRERLRRSTA
jgi:2,3-dihydroxybenzoate-AMP ligase